MTALTPLDHPTLPAGVTARFVDGVNGLRMHILEAGERGRPCLLLLHGFPELAYSWRKIMPSLAAAGYHVIAPDQRGYGRTTGSDNRYEADLATFRPFNLVREAPARGKWAAERRTTDHHAAIEPPCARRRRLAQCPALIAGG